MRFDEGGGGSGASMTFCSHPIHKSSQWRGTVITKNLDLNHSARIVTQHLTHTHTHTRVNVTY